MIIPDVNLLLYAVISGFPQHDRARAWWEDTVNGPGQVGLAHPALFGFLRIATNRRVISDPLTASGAVAYVRDWLAQPNIEELRPGARHLDIAFGLLEDVGSAGNLTTDVQVAAYAIERDAQVQSNDTDFARFPGLTWVNPSPVT